MPEPSTVDRGNPGEHRPSSAAPEIAPVHLDSAAAAALPPDYTTVSLSCELEPSADEEARLMVLPPAATEDEGVPRNPPPSYHQATGHQAPPPAYESLFGEILGAKRDSASNCQFFRTIAMIFGGVVGVLVFLGLQLALPLAMVTIGAMHLDHCTAQPWLGTWLGSAGLLMLCRSLPVCVLTGVSSIGRGARYNTWYDADESGSWAALLMAHLGLLGLGCGLVFSIFSPEFTDVSAASYCDFSLYVTAFVAVVVMLVTAAVCGIAVCCWMCACCPPPEDDEPVPSAVTTAGAVSAATAPQ